MDEFIIHPYLLGNALHGLMWRHFVVEEAPVRPGKHFLLKNDDVKASVEVRASDVGFKAYADLTDSDAITMGLPNVQALKTMLGSVEDEDEAIVTAIDFELLAEVEIV
jgi:hypothetical protein